jgi:hypothetical protein
MKVRWIPRRYLVAPTLYFLRDGFEFGNLARVGVRYGMSLGVARPTGSVATSRLDNLLCGATIWMEARVLPQAKTFPNARSLPHRNCSRLAQVQVSSRSVCFPQARRS